MEIEGFDLGEVSVCNLSDTDASGTTWAHTPPKTLVAIDPVLGRIAFQEGHDEPPRVTFHYGFSADMGGGEYERTPTFDAALGPVDAVASPGPIQPALDGRASGGVVELSDSGRLKRRPRSRSTPECDWNFGRRTNIAPLLSWPGQSTSAGARMRR